MKLAFLIITFLLVLSLNLNAQDKIFENISNRTWFDETGFAGESIVFIKLNNGKLKGIKQVNGSGLPVLFTEIIDLEIQNDTIYLMGRQNPQTNAKSKISFYTYNDQAGLLRSGKRLKVLFDKPVIYVSTKKGHALNTLLNFNDVTKILFEQNEVYINDKVFKINRD